MVSCSADCGRALVFNSNTGTLLHTVTVSYQPSAIALSERTGHAFIAGMIGNRSRSRLTRDQGVLSEIDVQSGHVLRTITLHVPIVAIAVDDRRQRVITLRKLEAFDIRGALESSSRRSSVAIDIRDVQIGAPLRSIPVSVFPTGIVVDKQMGHIFVADLVSDVVSILDSRSGSVIQTVSLGPLPPSVGLAQAVMDQHARRLIILHPPFAGGVGGRQPQVTVVDTVTGRIVHVAVPGRATTIAADQQSGLVYIGAEKEVRVLDPATGHWLYTIPTDRAPAAIAVDGRSKHAFIVMGESTAAPDPWAWIPIEVRHRLPFLSAPPAHVRTVPGYVRILEVPY
jgi:YVTN family beta-propeller protein